jgi:MYXO-CTERM domain-containing protein
MRRLSVASSAATVVGLLCFLSQSACNATHDDGRTATEPVQTARELIRRVHDAFQATVPTEDGRSYRALPLLAPPVAQTFDYGNGLISPYFAASQRGAVSSQADVALPARANGAFKLSDRLTNLGIEVALEGAQDAPGEAVDGYMVYRNAVAAGHVIHRPQPDGTEDWVVFDSAPSVPEVRYGITLAKGVAGLRLVADTLEFLDWGGTPRLRMAAPMLVGADGARQWASVEVQGCAVDTSPQGPWGRAPVSPGASQCSVSIRWGAAVGQKDPVYPAIMDPAWTTTGNMTVKRYYHTAMLLGDGRVLVAGGRQDNTTVHNKTELFSPSGLGGSFASSATMSTTRTNHAACILSDGRVMVAGGQASGGTTLASAEAFDPNTAQWTTLAPMATARANFTLTPLPSGEVLAAGGDGLASAELYVVAGNSWQPAASMAPNPRAKHTATLLPDGKVLVTGGESPSILNTAELFDRTNNSWTQTPVMAVGRSSHTATALDNGLVLVAGGDGNPVVIGAQLYNSNDNTWSVSYDMATARRYHTASRLLNGRVVIAGGYTNAYIASSEMFDQGTLSWAAGGDLKTARIRHTSTTLNNGKILATGGQGTAGGLSSAELFELQKNGLACTSASECTTGWCIDSVCCDTACPGKCMACTAALKGQGNDGECGAVANGVDLENECESLGTGICQTSGNCDGNGACGTQAGVACEGSLCLDVNTQQNPSTCDVDGNCVPQGQGLCAPYLCVGTGCLTSCTLDTDCVTGGACIDSTCKMPGDNGTSCGGNLDCTSGNCADMMCCDTACNTPCMSCRSAEKDSGPNGICGPAKVGLACGATSCESDVQSGPQCTATQTCEVASIPCAPFKCMADKTGCLTTCTSDSQCKIGSFCKVTQSQCLAKGVLGDPCAENKECQTGKCVDWVCCNDLCGGNNGVDCQACSAAKGASQDGVCTDLNNTVCNQGGINGVCSGGVCIEGVVDSGTDAPKDAPGDAPADTQAETATDAPLDTSVPEAGKDVTSPEGSAGSASDAPVAEASDDGAAGGQVAPPAASGDSGGCGCSTPGSSTSPSAWLALLGAAAIVIRRRRK